MHVPLRMGNMCFYYSIIISRLWNYYIRHYNSTGLNKSSCSDWYHALRVLLWGRSTVSYMIFILKLCSESRSDWLRSASALSKAKDARVLRQCMDGCKQGTTASTLLCWCFTVLSSLESLKLCITEGWYISINLHSKLSVMFWLHVVKSFSPPPPTHPLRTDGF